MKSTELSESRICPRWQFLLLGCSGPIRTILPNIGKYFRWTFVRFGSNPCENCVPSSSELNEIERIFRVTYMSSVTISFAGMQWTDLDHPTEHWEILPLIDRKVWVPSMRKLCSKQFRAKWNRPNFQSHVYVLGDNFYCWDAVDRFGPSRRTWQITSAERSEGLGAILAKTKFKAIPRKRNSRNFQSHVFVLGDDFYC
jgi:hypothetical protein